MTKLIFPDLLELTSFGGEFKKLFDEAYLIFESDFIKSKPNFNNLLVTAKKIPLVEGMHKTFYHITHEGQDESNRKPDIRRIERIRYPKFIITNSKSDEFKIWENKRGNDTKTVLLHVEQSYVVILTKRQDYYLFTTAYYIEQNHTLRKLLKEYETYIKAETA
jgi:hypothetical protein